MSADDRAINQDVFKVGLSRDRIENALKYIGFCPAAKPSDHKVPCAVPCAGTWRQVAPGSANPDLPQHGFEKQPVGLRRHPARPRRVRQKGFNYLPTMVRNDKTLSRIHAASNGSLTHKRRIMGILNVHRPWSVSRSIDAIPCCDEVVSAFGWLEQITDCADLFAQSVAGCCGSLADQGFGF